jgi:hypothetical protein
MPYNLLPNKCLKQAFIFLVLFIPDPKEPKKQINIFLRTLMKEMKELWQGVDTYDNHLKYRFNLCAAYLWSIHSTYVMSDNGVLPPLRRIVDPIKVRTSKTTKGSRRRLSHVRHSRRRRGCTGHNSRRDCRCRQRSHKWLEAWGNHRGGLAGRRGGRTCRGSELAMVETVEPDSKRKSRSVKLDEAVSGKLSSSKTACRETSRQFVERSRQ